MDRVRDFGNRGREYVRANKGKSLAFTIGMLVFITIVIVLILVNTGHIKNEALVKHLRWSTVERLVPAFCKDPEFLRKRKLIPRGAAGVEDPCEEKFTNTVKDIYGFNEIVYKMGDQTSDLIVPLPKGFKGPNNVSLENGICSNQLLLEDKQPWQCTGPTPPDKLLENREFRQYWKEFAPDVKINEAFCVYPANVSGNSKKCLMNINKLENQHVKTTEHYFDRYKVKEGINFNTYKPLANHAGITDNDLLPKGYGLLHHQYLDRFKYAPPLADLDPQYDIPYEFKKETFANKGKKNYLDFLKEYMIDNRVKENHKDFVKHLKEKNINGNKAKELTVMSGDDNICGSVLASDCFSNLGICGGASYGSKITSGEAYAQHKAWCQNYCEPVAHCVDRP